jgi:hypothetical protein
MPTRSASRAPRASTVSPAAGPIQRRQRRLDHGRFRQLHVAQVARDRRRHVGSRSDDIHRAGLHFRLDAEALQQRRRGGIHGRFGTLAATRHRGLHDLAPRGGIAGIALQAGTHAAEDFFTGIHADSFAIFCRAA